MSSENAEKGCTETEVEQELGDAVGTVGDGNGDGNGDDPAKMGDVKDTEQGLEFRCKDGTVVAAADYLAKMRVRNNRKEERNKVGSYL